MRYDVENHIYHIEQEKHQATIRLSSKKNNRPSVKIASTSKELQNKLELLLSCIDTAIYPLAKPKTKRR